MRSPVSPQACDLSLLRLFPTGLLAIFIAGCAPSNALLTPPYPAALKPRQEVAVWMHDSVLHLHSVRIRSDTLSGVPILRPPECDSCRMAVPLASVDSLTRASTERGAILAFAIPILTAFAVLLWWASSVGDS
jgi:hypothetical protein